MLRTVAVSWLVQDALVSADSLHATFYVRQQPALTAELRDKFEQVSDPASAAWGDFLSFEEVIRLQRPLSEHTNAVIEHCKALGALSIDTTIAGDKVKAVFPEDVPQTLLTANGNLQEAVDFVSTRSDSAPTTTIKFKSITTKEDWEKSRTVPAATANPQDCLFDKAIPPCIRTAYGLNNTAATATAFNAQTVVVNQGYKAADLAEFEKTHKLPSQTVVKEVGKNDHTAGDEASLDVQFIIGSGQLVPTWWVFIDGHSKNPFDTWITWASNTSQIPFVHSLSVGEPESEIAADNGGEAFIARMNSEMMALGARGASLVFASGDSGYVADQKYPASSPYVTAVGGVTWGSIFKASEIGVDPISTGGFSSMTSNTAQAYQTAAVQNYIHNTSGTRPAGNINPARRCVPDLSAYSTGFYIIQDLSETVIGGTSASTPVVAGMLALINDALIAKGLKPLGFANPFLYANEDAFLDITTGDNGGYAAVKGYDPASGLGTFSVATFSVLRDRALSQRMALAARKA